MATPSMKDDAAAAFIRSLRLSLEDGAERTRRDTDADAGLALIRPALDIEDAAHRELAEETALINFIRMAGIVGDPTKTEAIATTVARDVARKYHDFVAAAATTAARGHDRAPDEARPLPSLLTVAANILLPSSLIVCGCLLGVAVIGNGR